MATRTPAKRTAKRAPSKKKAKPARAKAKSKGSPQRANRSRKQPGAVRQGSLTTASGRKRLAVVYDINGPRVRLGFLWFVLVISSVIVGSVVYGGSLPLAVLYAIASLAAAGQSSRCWRAVRGKRRPEPNPLGAAVFAGLIPLFAVAGPQAAGVAVLALPIGAVAFGSASKRPASVTIADAGYTIQVALFPGLAAASVVLLRDLTLGAAIALIVVVSVYECGDFLVGTGAPNALEGPIAGIAAVLVVTFGIAALQVEPFGFASAFVFGLIAAALIPCGQLFASALLPRANSKAPALRRLDSLLLVGPVWYILIDLFLV